MLMECTKCDPNYDLWNKVCYPDIIGCKEYNTDGCTKCGF